jgi:hypothetical protein
MSDEPITVDPVALRGQAAEVDALAGAVDQASSAAASMNLGGGAFGLMCAFLVPPAVAVTSIARTSLRDASEMLRREADALRDLADDVEAFEEWTSAELTGLESEMGR